MTFEQEFPDNNGNGIPDAFENRPSISPILNPTVPDILARKPWAEPRIDSTDKQYRVIVGDLPPDKVILFEVFGGGDYRRVGACLVKTRSELQELIDALQHAGTEAFGLE